MREAFPDLINAKSGCFKRELVRSLRTKDPREAKRLDHREALKAHALFDSAVQALRSIADLPDKSRLAFESGCEHSRPLLEQARTRAENRSVANDPRRRQL